MIELDVPETLVLLSRHGVDSGFRIWSSTHGLPPGQLDDGWELHESDPRYGWQLRRWQGGRIGATVTFGSESEACAALLRALLGSDPPGSAPRRDAAFTHLLDLWRRAPWRTAPASRVALTAALHDLGVPAGAYSLYGGRYEGRLCLEERVSGWHVLSVRNGEREGSQKHDDEPAACLAFWRRLTDDHLPTMLGVHPHAPLPVPGTNSSAKSDPGTPAIPGSDAPTGSGAAASAASRTSAPTEPATGTPAASGPDVVVGDDDLTIPELLAIWDRKGGIRPSGLHSPRYGLDVPGHGLDLYELESGRWELRYSERGQVDVVGRYVREGDACVAVLGSSVSSGAVYASATTAKLATSHAATNYERLLYHWRLHPWRHSPSNRDELAYLMRDNGFPAGSYNLAGGRAANVLTLEERADHWRVYQVDEHRRTDQTLHPTESAACDAYWRRAVDQVIPALARDWPHP